MIGLDTNSLIRLVIEDDPDQTPRIRNAVRNAVSAGERCRINRIVLVESVWVLESVFGWKRPQVAAYLETLFDNKDLDVEDEDAAKRALAAYQRGTCDFADAFLVLTNTAAGCSSTLTFDRKAARLADFQLIPA